MGDIAKFTVLLPDATPITMAVDTSGPAVHSFTLTQPPASPIQSFNVVLPQSVVSGQTTPETLIRSFVMESIGPQGAPGPAGPMGPIGPPADELSIGLMAGLALALG